MVAGNWWRGGHRRSRWAYRHSDVQKGTTNDQPVCQLARLGDCGPSFALGRPLAWAGTVYKVSGNFGTTVFTGPLNGGTFSGDRSFADFERPAMDYKFRHPTLRFLGEPASELTNTTPGILASLSLLTPTAGTVLRREVVTSLNSATAPSAAWNCST